MTVDLALRENPGTPWWAIALAGLGAGLGAAWLIGRSAKGPSAGGSGIPGSSWTYQNWGGGPVAPHVAVGQPTDPHVAPWLAQMQAAFDAAGIDRNLFRPHEFLHMEEAPGNPIAIPDPSYWPRLIQTIVLVVQPLRSQLNKPVRIYSGFRPKSYNDALENAAENSRHMWDEAVDFGAYTGDPADNRQLARLAALMYLKNADAWDMGVGIYGTEVPSVHADTGFQKRTWADTKYWTDLVTQLAA